MDDRDAVRTALEEQGVDVLPGRGLSFRDPWGNRIEVVQYDAVRFSKTEGVLRGMGLEELDKSDAARQELRAKGLAD